MADKRRIVGIEAEERDAVDLAGSRGFERGAGARHSFGDDLFQHVGIDADPLAEFFTQSAQFVELLRLARPPGRGLVVHLGDGGLFEPLVGGFVDLARLGLWPPDAFPLEPFRQPLADHLSGGAELLTDALGLAHERPQDDVFGTLLVIEVAAPHLRRGLKLAIDAAVALFEPRRVPGQIDVDQIVAAHLEVDAFARGVGADEDAQRIRGRVGVEATLQLLAAFGRGCAGEDGDAIIGRKIVQRFGELDFEPAARVLVFREENQLPIVPASVRRSCGG